MHYVWSYNSFYAALHPVMQRPALDWRVVDDVLAQAIGASGIRIAVVLADDDLERITNYVYVFYEPLLDISIGIDPARRGMSITATDILWNRPALQRLQDDVGAAAQRDPIAALLEVAAAIDRLASTFQLTSPPEP